MTFFVLKKVTQQNPIAVMPQSAASPRELVCTMCWQELFSTPDFQQLCQAPFKDDGNGCAEAVELLYETSVSKIEFSASVGCRWCSFLLEGLKLKLGIMNQGLALEPLRVLMKEGHQHSWDNRPEKGGILDCSCTPPGNNQFILLFVLGKVLKTVWFDLFRDTKTDPMVAVTASDNQVQLRRPSVWVEAEQWLSDCAQHGCCPRPSPRPLPNRVIDVGLDPTGRTVRLVSGQAKPALYVALSYCWGPVQTGVTNSQNIKERWTSIDTQSLSLSIQDAIWATRQLGLSYLWVDAVCIIQDSLEDKLRELETMAAIYQQAYVTIIAASSESASDGFLGDRQRSAAPTHTFPFWTQDKRLTSIRGRRREDTSGEETHIEPLDRRAWAFQENLLSNRRLLFTTRAMQYECRQHRVSLGRAHSRLPLFTGARVFASPASIMILSEQDHLWVAAQTLVSSRRLRSRSAGLPGSALQQAWQAIVAGYTGRSLKFRDDVFSAIAAVAEQFQPHVGRGYLAGLWDGPMLPALLLWMATLSDQPEAGFATEELAPSWSWASVGYSTSYFPPLRDKKIVWHGHLICAQVTLRYKSLPYGPVNFGYLRFQSKVRRAHYERSSHPRWWFMKGAINKLVWYPPGPIGRTQIEWFEQWATSIDPAYREQDSDVLCLALCRTDGKGDEDTRIHGLMVVETEQQGIYRRVGMFHSTRTGHFDECETRTLILV